MNYSQLRQVMVENQLQRRGIADSRVLEAMEWVPREEFVPEEFREAAYEDVPQPIGLHQTISQPFTVAFMCQEARLTASDKVLEIGTGSGYGAAVLSLLAREVHSIERLEDLFRTSRERLARLGYKNVHVHLGDGTRGLPDETPFDAILVTAGAETLPRVYLEQLADGGRLLIPVGPVGHQQMLRVTRTGDQWHQERLGGFGFVPLIGGEVSDDESS